ncbi:MAG: DNA-processing protein DprA [Proteobacteria bacterium]|nr:DNA-processing protein DprA [Pseudomonadota bacterium]MBU1715546.1 DNA-processing protein DprA [Pseudomonadota bacterium]
MQSKNLYPQKTAEKHDNLDAWLTLYLTPGLGSAGCRKLVDFFGTPQQVLKTSRDQLLRVPGIRKNVVPLINGPEARNAAEQELIKAQKAGISILTIDDQNYPDLLRNIHDPPVLLYVKGDLNNLSRPCLGIVGSRAASTYGLEVAEKLAGQLAQRGLTIVSGLALGIDGAAHRGALKAKGHTMAVLGCGLDVVYPIQHRQLYSDIPQAGALISEYPLGTKPEGFRFPARNRIISGLSLGVLIVEAAKRSGSLITAHLALDQGREVFAIPGRVDSQKSEGTHRLLQEGAKLVQSVDDILEELNIKCEVQFHNSISTLTNPESLNQAEKKILTLLDVYPKSIDEIIQETGLTVQKVNESLLLLELKGCIEVLPGKQYKRKIRSG